MLLLLGRKPNPEHPGESLLDADGKVITINCDPLDAIINPVTGLFQSGDRAHYALINKLRQEEAALKGAVSRLLKSSLLAVGWNEGDARPEFDEATQKQLDEARKKAEMAGEQRAIAEEVCQKRGRERVLGKPHDHDPLAAIWA